MRVYSKWGDSHFCIQVNVYVGTINNIISLIMVNYTCIQQFVLNTFRFEFINFMVIGLCFFKESNTVLRLSWGQYWFTLNTFETLQLYALSNSIMYCGTLHKVYIKFF